MWSFAPGVNSARQQYFPVALSFGDVPPVTLSELAWPFASSVLASPTWVPPEEQSPPLLVTSAGWQRKNLAEPTPGAWGVPMVASAWYGLMLPAHAPHDVVMRLNTEVNKILKNPEIHDKLVGMGAEVWGGTPEEFAKFNVAEFKRYEAIVRDSGAPKE